MGGNCLSFLLPKEILFQKIFNPTFLGIKKKGFLPFGKMPPITSSKESFPGPK